jgi:arylsulfatase A-like enzyme
VPCMVRWPGKIRPSTVSNEIVSHLDWLPTLLAIAGDSNVIEKLLKGYQAGDTTYKVHVDGYNLLPLLTGKTHESPRESFLHCNDDQQLTGLRYDNWKLVFMEQRVRGTLRIWAEPFQSMFWAEFSLHVAVRSANVRVFAERKAMYMPTCSVKIVDGVARADTQR